MSRTSVYDGIEGSENVAGSESKKFRLKNSVDRFFMPRLFIPELYRKTL
jgi:hypothetical protein